MQMKIFRKSATTMIGRVFQALMMIILFTNNKLLTNFKLDKINKFVKKLSHKNCRVNDLTMDWIFRDKEINPLQNH